MAGQPPQDVPWQSSGQEQARAAWQPQETPFEPLAETAKHPVQSHAAPPPGDRGHGYPPPQHEYVAGRPDGYASGGPGYGAADQQASWDAPGQQASWQPPQAGQPGARRAAGSAHAKGFVASLFDFGFTSFVTPKLVKALYVLAALWTGLWTLILIRIGFHYGITAGLFMLILVIPVYALLSLGVIRVFLELFMVLHRINENIQSIRDSGDSSQL